MIISFKGQAPEVAPDAYLAEGSQLIGPVKVGARASIWFNAVLRADRGPIAVGDYTSIQDCCVLHGPVTVADHVTVGHAAVLHGATIEANCVIGMKSVILDGAVIGHGSVVAAGAVVLENTVVPPNSLVAGLPAKVVKPLPPQNEDSYRQIAEGYYGFAEPHLQGRRLP
ncbi:MAG: gamma carbonic anhydrase family protein [Candidatus Geothermincolia bacterium]